MNTQTTPASVPSSNPGFVSRLLRLAGVTLALTCAAVTAQAQTVWLGLSPTSELHDAKPWLYGLNVWDGFDPGVNGRADWRARMTEIGSPFLRFHAAEQISNSNRLSWIDPVTKTWVSSRIQSAITSLNYLPRERLVTISGWPSWMTLSNGKLDPAKKTDYANFCASLVEIVNTQLNLGVKYWEPINERDGVYSGSADMAELADIFKKAVAAMKLKDSTIKIVGGAWIQPYDPDITAFLANVGAANLDVWSHHQYGGDGSIIPNGIYNAADNLTHGVQTIRTTLNNAGFSAKPIWVTEHNIFWSWDADTGGYMSGAQGGVFGALVIRGLALDNKAQALFAWQDSGFGGSNYAHINYSWSTWGYDKLNPSGHVIRLYRTLGLGKVIASSSSDNNLVRTIAFKQAGSPNRVVLVLINRSSAARTVFLSSTLWSWTKAHRVTATGSQTLQPAPSLYYGSLPADSVTFYEGTLN